MSDVVSYAVSSTGERTAIQALIRQQYEQQGYTRDTNSFKQLVAYLMLPSTTTFVARKNSTPLGTVSVIADSDHGIPMAAAFPQQIQTLRDKQLHLAEVSQLAIDSALVTQRERFDILRSLFSLVFHHARHTAISCLCIAINPKHEKLYDALSFTTLGVRDAYQAVSGAPAIAKWLDVPAAAAMKTGNPLIQHILRDTQYEQLNWPTVTITGAQGTGRQK